MCGGVAPNVVRNCRAGVVDFSSTAVEIRALPVISRLRWRSVPELCEIWDSCYLGTWFCEIPVLHHRTWLGARKCVGAVRRLLSGPVETVNGVFLRSRHEHGCLRNSMRGLTLRCCKRKRHLSVMIFRNTGVKLM